MELEMSALRKEIDGLRRECSVSRSFIDAIHSPLVFINGSGLLLDANIHALNRYGLTRADINTAILWERFDAATAEEWQNEIAKTIRTKSPERFQFDENNRVREVFIWPAFDSRGRIRNFALMEKDITDNVRAMENLHLFKENSGCSDRQMHQASRLINLGTLVSGIAHEISNPNSFILTNAPLLENIWNDLSNAVPGMIEQDGLHAGGLAPAELMVFIPQLLKGISDGARRIDRIVKSLKSFSRFEIEETFEPVCLNSVIKTCLLFINNEIAKSTRAFSTDLDKDLPFIAGISQRLEQLVINLILNACQSLDSESRSVRISTTHNGKHVFLTVSDQGCGIPRENMTSIFDPFFTTKTGSKGTGLGLSITKKIVEEHNGQIQVESEPGAGTAVTVTFPAMKESFD